jgi:SCP-2 sterol transfer family
MTSPTKTFFDELSQRGHVPWLEQEHGRIRFEIVDEECVSLWTVAFDDGDVWVNPDDSRADGVLRADRVLFDRVVTGEERIMPATLRGEFSFDGSMELIVQFSKLLPGSPGQTGPRTVDGSRGRAR